LISLSHSMTRRGDLFGVSGRRGGHGLDLPGAEGALLRARPANEPLPRSRGALFSPQKAGGEINRGDPTQVCRALEQFGVEHIGAYSPHSPPRDGRPSARPLLRGRSERTFGTLQDRLGKELALAGITDIEAANAFIREVYLPAHNARFAVVPAGEGLAFTPFPPCAPAFRQGPGQGPCLSRSMSIPTARPLSPAALHRPLRRERNDQRCEKRRLKSARQRNPVDGMDKLWLAYPVHRRTRQKTRTFGVLPKPDNLIRYRQEIH
jgi:hypothetical protein